MQPNPPQLRPMDLGGLLDSTFALYRQNFALFAGIAAVLLVPQALLSAGLALIPTASLVTGSGSNSVFHSDAVGGVIVVNVGRVWLQLIFSALATGALSYAISQRYLGRQASILGTYTAVGVGTLVLLLVATILQGIGVFIGFVLFFVPGLIFFVRWQFVPQCLVLERTGLFGSYGSFGRSWNLVGGSFWRVLGYIIVVGLITAIIEGIVGAFLGAIFALAGHLSAPLTAFFSGIVSIVITPFQLIALTLLYYDLRIRKEGFDVEHLMQRLEYGRPL